jgi:hypothetical protein
VGVDLGGTWPVEPPEPGQDLPRRDDIRVVICGCSFSRFTGLDLAKLSTSVSNAVDHWNVYGQVDIKLKNFGLAWGSPYHPMWNPLCGDEDYGCKENENDIPSGYIYLRGEQQHGAVCRAAGTNCSPCGDITDCTVSFYHQTLCGDTVIWSFDHTDGTAVTFESTLLHELGHDVGFPVNASNPFPYTVMHGDPLQRTLWYEDITKLRSTPTCSVTDPYNLKQNRFIRHKRSTDNGLTWVDQDDSLTLNETTNSKPAIAFGSTMYGNRYVLAWAGTTASNRINTIVGKGDTWYPASKVTHMDADAMSQFGPSIAFGNGKWVLTWAGKGDSSEFPGKKILYKTSTNGVTWSAVHEIGYPGTYGALGAPVVTYNASKQRFVIAFVNWATIPRDEDVPYGRIRACTSQNPDDILDRFVTCSELGAEYASYNTPGLECHESSNECVLTGIRPAAVNDNEIWHTCASLSRGGLLVPGTVYSQGSAWSTRSEVATTQGNGYYLLAFRGQNGSTSGNTGRKSGCTALFGNKYTFPTVSFLAGPEIVHGVYGGVHEFEVYYTVEE